MTTKYSEDQMSATTEIILSILGMLVVLANTLVTLQNTRATRQNSRSLTDNTVSNVDNSKALRHDTNAATTADD